MKKGINMRKIILTLVPAIGLLLPLVAQAQGTLYLSNLGEGSGGSVAVASDAWSATLFVPGSTNPDDNVDSYVLNSVQLLMDPASGSPSEFNVSIYTSNPPRFPGVFVGNLVGSDPAAGGIFTYTASGITL